MLCFLWFYCLLDSLHEVRANVTEYLINFLSLVADWTALKISPIYGICTIISQFAIFNGFTEMLLFELSWMSSIEQIFKLCRKKKLNIHFLCVCLLMLGYSQSLHNRTREQHNGRGLKYTSFVGLERTFQARQACQANLVEYFLVSKPSYYGATALFINVLVFLKGIWSLGAIAEFCGYLGNIYWN